MRAHIWMLLAGLTLTGGCAATCDAQNGNTQSSNIPSGNIPSSEADLTAMYVGKPLLLRGLWGDDKLKFDAAGQPAERYAQISFTLCGINVTRVKVSGDRVRFEGERVALAFARDGAISRLPLTSGGRDPRPEKMSVEVDGHGQKDLTAALTAIFTEDLAVLAPTLPEYWHRYAHNVLLKDNDNEQTTKAPKQDRAAHVGGRMQPPKVLHMVDADFDEDARRLKYSGNVMVSLVVDKDGTPSHIQIQRPAGVGLDEMAVKAVSRYVFRPAMQDDVPVKVELNIDVNFQIF